MDQSQVAESLSESLGESLGESLSESLSESLFEIEHLRVAYPFQRGQQVADANALDGSLDGSLDWAVDDVSLVLKAGDRLGLVGESGCGKSTLGRAAVRLLPADTRIEGRVLFRGRNVFELNPAELRQFRGEVVSIVFQDPMTRLDPLMTIGDHCVETLRSHVPNLSRAAAKERAIATLEAVNIPASRWSQYPHEFSGGMRQRVAIALALLLNPKLIIADEPTTSLDVTVSAQILQELTRLCQERDMGLLLISHDLALVGEYCDRIAVMYDGKVVETGPTATVLTQPQHTYTQSLLQSALHIQSTPTSTHPNTPTPQHAPAQARKPAKTLHPRIQFPGKDSVGQARHRHPRRRRHLARSVSGRNFGAGGRVGLRQKHPVAHHPAAGGADGRQD